jgi:hypothetical protein
MTIASKNAIPVKRCADRRGLSGLRAVHILGCVPGTTNGTVCLDSCFAGCEAGHKSPAMELTPQLSAHPGRHAFFSEIGFVCVYLLGSSGESVGEFRGSALRLSEESVKLAARGVEGMLHFFPSIMDDISDKFFCSYLSQRRVFVHVADDLSTEKPQVVDVSLDGLFRQAWRGEIQEEWREVLDKFPAGRKIILLAHPTLRPLIKIAAVGQQRSRRQWRRIGIYLHLCIGPSQFMRLPRILNQCHPIPGFGYEQAPFAEDEQGILVPVRPPKRSTAICSGCHQPAPSYDRSPTPRLFEFIGFWGYLVGRFSNNISITRSLTASRVCTSSGRLLVSH